MNKELFGGRYFVSDDGEIFTRSGKKMKPHKKKTGYYEIHLYDENGVLHYLTLHRLVALSFCDGYREGFEVNHINGNKADNRKENLEWISHGENLHHAYETGLRDDDVAPRAVIATNIDTLETMEFSSIYKAARFLGISQGNICMVCKRIRPSASGYIFRYKAERR